MVYVFIINIISYFAVSLLKIKFFSKYFKENKLLNPFIILYLASLPVDICRVLVGPLYLLDNAVANPYYNYAIFVTTVGLLFDYFLLIITVRLTQNAKFVSKFLNFKTKPHKMLFAAFGFYLLFLISFFLLANHSFGIVNWIKDPRTGYQHYREGAGQFWIFAISFLSVSFTLVCIYIKRYPVLFALFLFYIFSAYFLGSKGILLDFFIFLFIVLWLRRFKYVKKIFFIGLPLAILLMLVNFAGNSGLSGLELKNVFSYFDHYVNSTMYFEAYFKGEVFLHKGEIFLTDFWGLVPRALYGGKPYSYGITIVNEHFWPGAAENSNTPAFGGPIPYFADFGLFGVITLSFFNPIKFIGYFFLGQLLKNYTFESISNNVLTLCLFIIFTSPYFLYGLPFPSNLIFYFFTIVLIVFFNRVVFKNKNI